MNKKEIIITNMVKSLLSGFNRPKDFSGVAVDVYPSEYGEQIHITMLFEKPFKREDSDKLHDISRDIKSTIKKYFGDFRLDISVSNSTIDSYNNQKWWYEEQKLKYNKNDD